MPGSATDYLEARIIDHTLGTTTYTKPTGVYIALFTVTPSESGAGTEVTGGSYARQVATFTSAVSTGSATNTALLTFSNMPSCTVVAAAIMDAVTGGNILYYYTLPNAKTYNAGDTATIALGTISVVLN